MIGWSLNDLAKLRPTTGRAASRPEIQQFPGEAEKQASALAKDLQDLYSLLRAKNQTEAVAELHKLIRMAYEKRS